MIRRTLLALNLSRFGKTRDPNRRTSFPIVRDRARWPAEAAAKLADVGESERTDIEQLQPYRAEGHDPLLWLADLSRRDKHRILNLVVARAGFMDERLETGLQGWAHLAGEERRRAVIKSPAGEIKNEMEIASRLNEQQGLS